MHSQMLYKGPLIAWISRQQSVATLIVEGDVQVMHLIPCVYLEAIVDKEGDRSELSLQLVPDIYQPKGPYSITIFPYHTELTNPRQYKTVKLVSAHGSLILKIHKGHPLMINK